MSRQNLFPGVTPERSSTQPGSNRGTSRRPAAESMLKFEPVKVKPLFITNSRRHRKAPERTGSVSRKAAGYLSPEGLRHSYFQRKLSPVVSLNKQ